MRCCALNFALRREAADERRENRRRACAPNATNGQQKRKMERHAPSQTKAFLDVSENAEIAFGRPSSTAPWTTATRRGSLQPTRARRMGESRSSRICAALDMHKSEVSEQVAMLATERKISNEGGRIWLRADNPAPVLVRPRAKRLTGEEKAE
jgi:hypothetical protein